MKNLFKNFICLALLISLASCGGDEVSSDGLEGTWELIEITSNSEVTTTISIIGETLTSISELSGENIDFEITFDESTYSGQGSYDMVGFVTTTGIPGQIPFNESLNDITSTGNYSATDNQMTITGSFVTVEFNGMTTSGGQEQTVDYVINSDNELIITQSIDLTETVSGAVTTTKASSRTVLVRK